MIMKAINFSKKEIFIASILGQFLINSFIGLISTAQLINFKAYKNLTVDAIVLVNIFFVFLNAYLIYHLFDLVQKEHKLQILQNEKLSSENLSVFFHNLKHDIGNQLAVLYGMIQMGKIKEVADKTEFINKQFEQIEGLLSFNNVEIASLILDKVTKAKGKNINVEQNISVESFGGIPTDIITRVLGNLLDNAIEALEHQKDKELIIDIFSKTNSLYISIENTGEIPPAIAENMFKRGFSTKKDKQEHGLGLDIVKTLIEDNGGAINHTLQEGMTIFEVSLPFLLSEDKTM